jgi:NAD(P)-dependent dehydrogenase (short-subunit alcohol dehydrogenase family)
MAALDGLPPPRLLVNNASRFVIRQRRRFHAESWDAHLDVNLRAPALLSQAFAGAPGEGPDRQPARRQARPPNPDFFSYTISKIRPRRPHRALRARLCARGIRVCGIAPSVTLVSGPQSRENFDAVHALNALGRGVTSRRSSRPCASSLPRRPHRPDDHLDGGQRFLGLPRDVQFLEPE